MNKTKKNRKKEWVYALILFALLMLALMINDAMNHPEDFKKGYDSTIIKK